MGRRDVHTLEMITLKLLPRRGDLWQSVMSDTRAMRGPPVLKPGAEESIPCSSSMASDGVQVVLNKSSLFPFALSEVLPSHHQIKALRRNDKFNCFWCAFGMLPNWARWRSPKHFPFLSVKMDLTNSSAQLNLEFPLSVTLGAAQRIMSPGPVSTHYPLASAKLMLLSHCIWGNFLLWKHPENSQIRWFQIIIEIKNFFFY